MFDGFRRRRSRRLTPRSRSICVTAATIAAAPAARGIPDPCALAPRSAAAGPGISRWSWRTCGAMATVASRAGLPDHSNYSFRRMAQDQVEVMAALGLRPVLRRRPTRAPHGLSHGARPSRRRSASLPVLISFHALPLDACQPGVGAQFVSLDLHERSPTMAPGAVPGGQGTLLHRAEAHSHGHWEGRLSPGDDRRVYAVLHAGAAARGVRGLPCWGDDRLRRWTVPMLRRDIRSMSGAGHLGDPESCGKDV